MKKLWAVLVLLAAPAMAQETYEIPAAAGNVTELAVIVGIHNRDICVLYGQAASCTQAEACSASGAPGGASCTPAQARAANVRIFPATFAGRQEFVIFQITAPAFFAMRAAIITSTQQAQCAFWTTATAEQRNTICQAFGFSPGCILCNGN